MIAINAKKAFDRMLRPALFNKLVGKIQHALWRCLVNYYSCAQAVVKNGDQCSDVFPTNVGFK